MLHCFDHLALNSEQPMTEWIITMAKAIAKASNQKISETSMDEDAQAIIDTETHLCRVRILFYCLFFNSLKKNF